MSERHPQRPGERNDDRGGALSIARGLAPGKATLVQPVAPSGLAFTPDSIGPGKSTQTQLAPQYDAPPMESTRAEAPLRADASPASASASPGALPRLDLGQRGAGTSPAGGPPATAVPAPAGATHGRGVSPAAPRASGANAGAELGAWVGASKVGEVFRHQSTETFVDPATKRTVSVETRWMLAELEQFELKTNAAMEIDRRIHLQLARSSVVAKSRARVFFHADRLPNDVHAALHAPARHLTHEGAIFVADERGMHLLRSLDHPALEEPSAAALLAREPMLGFDTPPEQRLAEAERFVSTTVPAYDRNLELVEAVLRDAPTVAIGLRGYIKAKLGYESPPPDALARGRHLIARLEELVSHSWTGYEGAALMLQLGRMRQSFATLVQQAETATPAEKGVLDHAADLVTAIGKAGVGVVTALKEVGLMARDLGLWSADRFVGLFGYEIDWGAASSVGKAYERGKSTSEIFGAMVGGLLDAWGKAIERAENGDYSKLMELGAELTLDVALGAAIAGAAAPGAAAKRAGTTAQLAHGAVTVAESTVEALTRRTQAVLARAQQAVQRAPERARAALLDTIDTANGWLTGLRESVKVADTGAGAVRLIDRAAIGQAILRVRGARALESARAAMTKLRGGTARTQGASVVEQLEKLAKASKMPDAIYAIAQRIAEGADKAKLVAALDKLLQGTARTLDHEVVAGVLRRAADAVDPLAFLDNVEWVMGRSGLSVDARKALMRQATTRESPLDLRWLRELTDLPDAMLEPMALNPATSWKSFMKVSRKPSDYFPSSLKKMLTATDYADAGAKLRGLAGELVFEINGVALPAGLKIVARQVQTGGKVLDFSLRDAAGQMARLEVKAWSAKRWAKEISLNGGAGRPTKLFGRLIKQMNAALATGDKVYLAVTDAIAGDLPVVRQILLTHVQGADRINIIMYPESSLVEVSRTLKKGLGIAVASTTVLLDGIEEDLDD